MEFETEPQRLAREAEQRRLAEEEEQRRIEAARALQNMQVQNNQQGIVQNENVLQNNLQGNWPQNVNVHTGIESVKLCLLGNARLFCPD